MLAGDTITRTFFLRDGSDIATNADTNPIATLYRNGDLTTETVTVSNAGRTGLYKYVFSLPETWIVGDEIMVFIEATVSSITRQLSVHQGTIITADAGANAYTSIPQDGAIPAQSDFNFVHIPASFPFSDRLTPKILESQRFDLRSTLGYDFYDEVMAVVNNSNTVLVETTFTQDSFDLLRPYLVNYVRYASYVRYLKSAEIHITRTGPVKKVTPHSENLSPEEKRDMVVYYDSLAADYQTELCEYLSDNSSLYPLWGEIDTLYFQKGGRKFYTL